MKILAFFFCFFSFGCSANFFKNNVKEKNYEERNDSIVSLEESKVSKPKKKFRNESNQPIMMPQPIIFNNPVAQLSEGRGEQSGSYKCCNCKCGWCCGCIGGILLSGTVFGTYFLGVYLGWWVGLPVKQ